MASIKIQLLTATGQPLPDVVDVYVVDPQSNTLLVRKTDLSAGSLTVTGLPAHRAVQVRVYPKRHRPIGHFVLTGAGSATQP